MARTATAPRGFRIIVPAALVSSAPPPPSAKPYGAPLDCSVVCRAVGRLATADEERAARASWVVVSFHGAPEDAADAFYSADVMPAPVPVFARAGRRVTQRPNGRLLLVLDAPDLVLVTETGAPLHA